LKDLSGPLQLHAGTGDEEVPIKFSQDLHQEVQAAGKKVEYFEYQRITITCRIIST
jgi:predicted esterase